MDEKLIELVAANEILYNTNHKVYKDLTVRDDIWFAISTVIGKNVQDCKTRWRSLRDLYHRKRKLKNGGKSSRNQWEYMKSMTFLENFISNNRADGRTKQGLENNDMEDNAGEYMVAIPFGIDDSDLEDIKRRDTMDMGYGNNSKKPKPNEMDDPKAGIERETVEFLRELRKANATSQHPTKTFFESMALTVMSFPPALAAEAKLKVCQIVTEIEARILDTTILSDSKFN